MPAWCGEHGGGAHHVLLRRDHGPWYHHAQTKKTTQASPNMNQMERRAREEAGGELVMVTVMAELRPDEKSNGDSPSTFTCTSNQHDEDDKRSKAKLCASFGGRLCGDERARARRSSRRERWRVSPLRPDRWGRR
jgi:hypothetical protein